jgi:uncharacterized membrane protein
MIQGALYIYLLGLIPTFEARYAVAVAAAINMPPLNALLIAFTSVATLSLTLPYVIPYIDRLAEKIQATEKPLVSRTASLYLRYVSKARSKAGKYLGKYGLLGLVLFIAAPLPGTGIWTGILGAHLLGLPRRTMITASLAGGTISVLIMFSATYPIIDILFH